MPLIRWYRAEQSNETGHTIFVAVEGVRCEQTEPLYRSIHLRDGFHGRDRAGYPLYWMMVGQLQLDKLYATETHLQLLDQMVRYLIEKIRVVEEDIASPVSLVMDLTGLSWHHMHPTMLKLLARGMSLYQGMRRPDLVRRVFVVNGSILLPVFWSAVQPLIPEELRKRIEFPSCLSAVIDSSEKHPDYV